MWPFRKVDGAHLELVAQLHGIVERVKQLEESLLGLEDRHERLRGRFYASRGGGDSQVAGGGEKTAPGASKAEILRRMGYIPGRPVPKA